MKRFVTAAVLAVMISATPCFADLTSTVTLDWSTFTVTPLALGGGSVPTFTWTDDGDGSVSAYASTFYPSVDDDDSDFVANWTDAITAQATTAKSSSSALRNATTLSATATTQADSNPVEIGYNYAYSDVENSRQFQISGKGILLFEVDWTMDLEGSVGDLDNYTSGAVGSYVELYSVDDNNWSDANTGISKWSDEVGAGTLSGTLTLAIVNQDGLSEGYFYGWAEADSESQSVPEPASFLLMLCGLGFVGLVARRKFK